MDSLDKKYYRIREVSELIGVPASTLRFWETCFPEVAPARNDRGTRFYTPQNIEKLRMVHYLVKDRGLKIEAAREQLRVNQKGVAQRADAVERLRRVRDKLQYMLDALTHRK
ncbi:MAG: MerR family transcriptional regulator [Muribaculaceae bacterium]|nr:MerR family transcriptional regulator [Muribaculaceae bacterium]